MIATNNILNAAPEVLRAEVAVVGSGPGGSITSCLLAEAGKNVVLVEEGSHHPLDPRDEFTQNEMVTKYRNSGVTVAMGPAKVAYVEGRCVGGGSEINSGLYHRTPPEILAAWQRDYALDGIDDLDKHFTACERELSVSLLPGPAPAASLKLHQGASQLGWKSIEVPRWYKYSPTNGSNGQSRGSRQSMTATFVPRFIRAGGQLTPNTKVTRLRRIGATWHLTAVQQQPDGARRQFEIRARDVFVACGAVQTPLLFRRSGLTHNIGNQLQLHPTVKVVAQFPDLVNSRDMGVPVHQVKQFAPTISFGCSISTPPHLALAMLDHPAAGDEVLRNWQHAAIYYAMVTPQGRGTVRSLPYFNDPLVRFHLADEDFHNLAQGLRRLCQLLLTSGAETLYCGTGGIVIRSEADLTKTPAALRRRDANLMTIHLFSSCPMGGDTTKCATDSFGKVYRADGLYVADASLLCTSPSVNPQGSIMAIARRNASRFLDID